MLVVQEQKHQLEQVVRRNSGPAEEKTETEQVRYPVWSQFLGQVVIPKMSLY